MTENANVSNAHDSESETLPPTEPSAATVARDQLLYAIGRSAVVVAADQPGNASAALAELARAFALVTTGSARAVQVDPEPIELDPSVLASAAELGYPATGAFDDVPALTAAMDDARAHVLSAVGRSAVFVAEEQPGNAPAALVELARAYALTTARLLPLPEVMSPIVSYAPPGGVTIDYYEIK